MTSALVGMYLREETHLHEFGSPSFLLLNRTREVRFRLLVIFVLNLAFVRVCVHINTLNNHKLAGAIGPAKNVVFMVSICTVSN